MKDATVATFAAIAKLTFLVMSTMQIFPAYAALHHHWHWHSYFAGLTALACSYMPGVGLWLALTGAIKVWHWTAMDAWLLYGIPFLVFAVTYMTASWQHPRIFDE